jgi:hypothetical protein
MKGLIKRCNELRWDVIVSSEIVLYLGDIQGILSNVTDNFYFCVMLNYIFIHFRSYNYNGSKFKSL